MKLISKSTADTAGSLATMLIAAAVVCLSALVFLPVLALNLMMFDALIRGPRAWFFSDPYNSTWWAAWSVLALLVAIHNIGKGLSVASDPSGRGLALLLCLSVAILATCPIIWGVM